MNEYIWSQQFRSMCRLNPRGLNFAYHCKKIVAKVIMWFITVWKQRRCSQSVLKIDRICVCVNIVMEINWNEIWTFFKGDFQFSIDHQISHSICHFKRYFLSQTNDSLSQPSAIIFQNWLGKRWPTALLWPFNNRFTYRSYAMAQSEYWQDQEQIGCNRQFYPHCDGMMKFIFDLNSHVSDWKEPHNCGNCIILFCFWRNNIEHTMPANRKMGTQP